MADDAPNVETSPVADHILIAEAAPTAEDAVVADAAPVAAGPSFDEPPVDTVEVRAEGPAPEQVTVSEFEEIRPVVAETPAAPRRRLLPMS